MTKALFIPDGGRFVPTRRAASPWADNALHGGPPAGLLARAIEAHATSPGMQVVRLTTDLSRRVPAAPLNVTVRSVRAGRRIHTVEASLLVDGVEMCRAGALLLRHAAAPVPYGTCGLTTPPGPAGFETTSIGGEPHGTAPRGRPGFHSEVEVRWVSRPRGDGPAIAWIRMPLPLVAGEEPSPLVRIAAIADFVNPVGSSTWAPGASFINTDSTIYLHRMPVGEWICLQVERRVEPHGAGVGRAMLFDTEGPVGSAMQALLADRRD